MLKLFRIGDAGNYDDHSIVLASCEQEARELLKTNGEWYAGCGECSEIPMVPSVIKSVYELDPGTDLE